MKTTAYVIILLLAALGYRVAVSPDWQQAIGAGATALVKPLLVPLVELINVPSFVYTLSVLILLAGFAACVLFWLRTVRPRLRELKAARAGIFDLPLPSVAPRAATWPQAMSQLGNLLRTHSVFVSAWSEFQAEAARARGMPDAPFAHYVASEPQQGRDRTGLMASLPGYFTSLGLIFTFIGLVVALYFAAKGFRTGNIQDARAAIIQLLNAASFKFLTSVAALISALIVSVCLRYGLSSIAAETRAIAEHIEAFVSAWREEVGGGEDGSAQLMPELLRRITTLIDHVQDLTVAMQTLVRERQHEAEDAHASR